MATSSTRQQPAQRRKAASLNIDWGLLLVVGALICFGLMMVYSTTFDWSYRATGSASRIFLQQVRSLGIGLLAMLVVANLDYHLLRRFVVPMMVGVLGMLGVVLILGVARFGAVRTLYQGSYQPSEAAKLVTIIYLAVWPTSKRDQLKNFSYGIGPYSIVVGIVTALILLQPDISAALTIVLIAITLLFLAGVDAIQMMMAAIAGIGVGYLVIRASPTGQARLTEYVLGLTDVTQASWHVQQAIIAFVTGGFFGRGLGESHQKFTTLPTPHTDSIFAIVGEELGVLGSVILIALFIAFVWRGMRIATQAKDQLGALLASGITCWVAFEALMNIAVMVAAMPFTGNALPFISYGGSAMVSLLVGVGILISISRTDPDKPIPRRTRATINHRRGDWRTRLSGISRRR